MRDERRLLKDFYDYKDLAKLENALDNAIITEAAFEEARKQQLEVLTADRKFRKRQIVVLVPSVREHNYRVLFEFSTQLSIV